MNRIEGEAKLFLGSVVSGKFIILTQRNLEVLAKWLTLKVMVVEHDAQDVVLTPQSDRTLFYKNLQIPNYYRFYLAENISEDYLYFVRHSHCIAYNGIEPNPPLEGTHKNVQVVTLIAGRAVFQVVCTRIENVHLEEKSFMIGFHDSCQIWPNPPSSLKFPCRPRLGKDGINQISTILQRYIDRSNPTWV
ncbi:hypothetical protein [Blastomonas sp. AAP25]|uniref:hypothetical protein n=1 Tax=Blastomonas sp. AAP25 TaxID=1523416 RepID=UPI0012E2532F|nr:hypothetical protein [Blastomonas sp. AAP25]